jgi:hypothetical protein
LIISSTIDRYGEAGSRWYLLPTSWWMNWKHFAQHSGGDAKQTNGKRSLEPGPIDNRCLLKKPGVSNQVQSNLVCGTEYEVVTASVWRALQSWYGGVVVVEREVVSVNEKQLQLEIYPLCLKVTVCDVTGKVRHSLCLTYSGIFSVACLYISHSSALLNPTA